MRFICVDGEGDPNQPTFGRAVETLYALTYSIRMSYKNGTQPAGFFEFVVPPLEGLWWVDDGGFDFDARGNWKWTAMIRQMDFVDEACFAAAVRSVHTRSERAKKPAIDVGSARLEDFTEGLCVQMMHIGPFANEPASVEKMRAFIAKQGLADETGPIRKHHEIYLGDPAQRRPGGYEDGIAPSCPKKRKEKKDD